ncbi:MAG: hypothetical protein ACKOZV_05155, partial [Bacteroidota bacterium]
TWQSLWHETKQAWSDMISGNYGKQRPTERTKTRPSKARTYAETPAPEEATAPETTLFTEQPPSTAAPLSLDLSQRSGLFAEDEGAIAVKQPPMSQPQDDDLELLSTQHHHHHPPTLNMLMPTNRPPELFRKTIRT